MEFVAQNIQMFISVAISMISIGVAYGTLKSQIKVLAEEASEYKRTAERLASLEAKMDIIITNFLKSNA